MSNTITPTVSIAPLTWRGWKSSIAKPVLPKCRLWSAKIRFDFQRNVTLLHCVEILGITGEITIRQRQALARSNFPERDLSATIPIHEPPVTIGQGVSRQFQTEAAKSVSNCTACSDPMRNTGWISHYVI